MSCKPKSRRESFTKAPDWLLARADLGFADKLVFAVIVDRMKDGRASIGIRRIMARLAASNTTVVRAVKRLEAAGLLTVERGRSGQRTVYRLPDKAVTESHRSDQGEAVTERHRSMALRENKAVTKSYRERCQKVTASGDKKSPRPDQTLLPDLARSTAPSGAGGKRAGKATGPPGKATGPHQALVEHFTSRWSEHNGGGKYPFDRARDPAAAKRILDHTNGDLDRARRIVNAYLEDDDSWLAEHAKGRPLSLLASNARLGKYLAATAGGSNSEAVQDHGPEEHPVLTDGRARGWGDDVDAHPAEWMDIARRIEAGELNTFVVKRSQAKSGAEFRESLKMTEVAAHG